MLVTDNQKRSVTAVPTGVDGAVGVPRPPAGSPHWYVAIVKHNSEHSAAERLTATGIECYVASQEEYRQWRNGRRKLVNRVVISGTIFIRCTEGERREIVRLPYINRFLVNRAASGRGEFGAPVAIIPDAQIERLRFMLGNSDQPVDFIERTYCLGERVRVVRGQLKGLEGQVYTAPDGTSRLVVALDLLGGAATAIPITDLEPIESQQNA